MPVILGTDGFRYEVVEDWAKLPPGYEFNADVAAVGVDRHDNVYAFSRGAHPVCVFDRAGNFQRSWGEGQYPRAHGLHMGPDDTIWLTDDGGHFVRNCALDGKVLLEIGIPTICERVLELTDYLCKKAQRAGCEIYSSRKSEDKSGIVSIIIPGADVRQAVKRCRAEGIVINQRAGRVRVSPHCYNSKAEIDRLVDTLVGTRG